MFLYICISVISVGGIIVKFKSNLFNGCTEKARRYYYKTLNFKIGKLHMNKKILLTLFFVTFSLSALLSVSGLSNNLEIIKSTINVKIKPKITSKTE